MNKLLHVAVVEDHDALREMTVDALEMPGHLVRGYESAEALLEQLDVLPVDIAVLDINLPGICGFTLAQRLRSENPNVGILMLTVRSELDDKLRGYDSGADSYLPKPVAPQELFAVVSSMSRRINQAATLNTEDLALTQGKEKLLQAFALDMLSKLDTEPVEKPVIASADEITSWRLSLDGWAFIDATGRSVQLTALERVFIQCLAGNVCLAVSREDLAVALGEDPVNYDYHRIDALISRLRKKALDQGVNIPVRAVRGIGYMII